MWRDIKASPALCAFARLKIVSGIERKERKITSLSMFYQCIRSTRIKSSISTWWAMQSSIFSNSADCRGRCGTSVQVPLCNIQIARKCIETIVVSWLCHVHCSYHGCCQVPTFFRKGTRDCGVFQQVQPSTRIVLWLWSLERCPNIEWLELLFCSALINWVYPCPSTCAPSNDFHRNIQSHCCMWPEQ